MTDIEETVSHSIGHILLPSDFDDSVQHSRLHRTSVFSTFSELFHNAWMAGSNTVRVSLLRENNNHYLIEIHDDGSGCPDPLLLLHHGVSGWDNQQNPSDSRGEGFLRAALCPGMNFIEAQSRDWQFALSSIYDNARVNITTVRPSDLVGMLVRISIQDARSASRIVEDLRKARGFYPYRVTSTELDRPSVVMPPFSVEEAGSTEQCLVLETPVGLLTVALSTASRSSFLVAKDLRILEDEDSGALESIFLSQVRQALPGVTGLRCLLRASPSARFLSGQDIDIRADALLLVECISSCARRMTSEAFEELAGRMRGNSILRDTDVNRLYQQGVTRAASLPFWMQTVQNVMSIHGYREFVVADYKSDPMVDTDDDDGSYYLPDDPIETLWVARELNLEGSAFATVSQSGLFNLSPEAIARAIQEDYELEIDIPPTSRNQIVFTDCINWGPISLPFLVFKNSSDWIATVVVRGTPREFVMSILGDPENSKSVVIASLLTDDTRNEWVEDGSLDLNEYRVYLAREVAGQAEATDPSLLVEMRRFEKLNQFHNYSKKALEAIQRTDYSENRVRTVLIDCPLPSAERDLTFAWQALQRVEFDVAQAKDDWLVRGAPFTDYESADCSAVSN